MCMLKQWMDIRKRTSEMCSTSSTFHISYLDRSLVLGGSTLVYMFAGGNVLSHMQNIFKKAPPCSLFFKHKVAEFHHCRLLYMQEATRVSNAEMHSNYSIELKAATLHEEMHPSRSIRLMERAFASNLKACAKLNDLEGGIAIHMEVARLNSLNKALHIGASLVDMYARCGLLKRAKQVFDQLDFPDVVCWNALMTGYTHHGLGEEALNIFELMKIRGIFPDANSLVCCLKAGRSVRAIGRCQKIHSDIESWGLLEREPEVGNTLVDIYAKFGLLVEAKHVLEMLPSRDAISWTALISGYADHGPSEEAFKCFDYMQKEGVVPDAVTYVCMLKACGNADSLPKGEQIHAEIEKQGFFEKNVLVGRTLIDMYVKCGLIARARKFFNRLSAPDLVSWTALIAGYAEHGPSEEALWCFEKLQLSGFFPDSVTFVCCLKASGCIGVLGKGQEIHAEVERRGLLEGNVVLGNALVDMYAKCGMLSMAQEIFARLHVKDVVSWNALITGYAEYGWSSEAIMHFEKMQLEGVFPNAATLVWSLKACGTIGDLDKCREIHADIDRRGMLETDLVVGSTLVDMYGKCGAFAQAQEVFDRLPDKDVLTWNALIAGYAESGEGEQAIKLLDRMQHTGVFPNAATYVCSLKACGSTGASHKGIELHKQLERQGLLGSNLVVGNSLIDMYSKCGSLSRAYDVFHKLPVKDVISWTTLMSGYAQFGESDLVFELFDKMLGYGIKPNLITFLVLLSACGRTGLYHTCQTYFEAMSKEYGFDPNLEHQNSLIDLYSRLGQLDKAITVIREMPLCPNLAVWRSVLGACKKWGNVAFAKGAFQQAVSLDERNAAAYVFMSQVCASTLLDMTNNESGV